jgi:hypothetical protein
VILKTPEIKPTRFFMLARPIPKSKPFTLKSLLLKIDITKLPTIMNMRKKIGFLEQKINKERGLNMANCAEMKVGDIYKCDSCG